MKVVLGICGREDSFSAMEEALQRAKRTGDDVTIAILEDAQSRVSESEVRDRVEQALANFDIEASVRTVEGHPGSRLLELADREGADHIVLGVGERSPLGKVQLDSAAEFVILNAKKPVTLVR